MKIKYQNVSIKKVIKLPQNVEVFQDIDVIRYQSNRGMKQ